MRKILLAALMVVCAVLPSKACTPSGVQPLNLLIPNFSDSGATWFGCLRTDLISLSSAATLSSTNTWTAPQTFTDSATFTAGIDLVPNLLTTSGTGVQALMAPTYGVTVPDGQSLSPIYLDCNNTSTTGGLFYCLNVKTNSSKVDTAAGISVSNVGASDNLYLGVTGSSSTAPGDNPTGIGIDLNRSGSGQVTSYFGGAGINLIDWTNANSTQTPVGITMSRKNNPDMDAPLLRLTTNRRAIDIVSGGYALTRTFSISTGPTVNFQIDSGGNVTISTSASFYFQENSGNSAFIQASATATSLDFRDGTGGYRFLNNGTGSVLAQIQDGGNLGVGTTNPQTVLEVNGTAQFGAGVTKSTISASGFQLTPQGTYAGASTFSSSSTLNSNLQVKGTTLLGTHPNVGAGGQELDIDSANSIIWNDNGGQSDTAIGIGGGAGGRDFVIQSGTDVFIQNSGAVNRWDFNTRTGNFTAPSGANFAGVQTFTSSVTVAGITGNSNYAMSLSTGLNIVLGGIKQADSASPNTFSGPSTFTATGAAVYSAYFSSGVIVATGSFQVGNGTLVSTVTPNGFQGNGSALTSLTAANINAGTLGSGVISSSAAWALFSGMTVTSSTYVCAAGNCVATIGTSGTCLQGSTVTITLPVAMRIAVYGSLMFSDATLNTNVAFGVLIDGIGIDGSAGTSGEVCIANQLVAGKLEACPINAITPTTKSAGSHTMCVWMDSSSGAVTVNQGGAGNINQQVWAKGEP